MARKRNDDKCPVCHGTGRAIDSYSGDPIDKDCLSCGGSGFAAWSNKFQELLDSGQIDGPVQPPEPDGFRIPRQAAISQHTSGYSEYVRLAHKYGSSPIKKETLIQMRKECADRGIEGMEWVGWDEPLASIALESESYPHYLLMINQYEKEHGVKLPRKDMWSVRDYRAGRRKDCYCSWSTKSYFLEQLIDGQMSGKTQKFNTFRELVYAVIEIIDPAETWIIFDTISPDGIGTTQDLREHVLAGARHKALKKYYIEWLQERSNRE